MPEPTWRPANLPKIDRLTEGPAGGIRVWIAGEWVNVATREEAAVFFVAGLAALRAFDQGRGK